MTAEAPSTTAPPGPARSPAAGADPSKQRRRDGRTRRGPRAPTRTGAGPVRDDPLVIHMGTCARSGDKQACDALVEQYAPLIWSICCSHRLGVADAEDVGQSVWLYLVEHLDRIRDPAALPRLAGHHHPA